MGGGVFATCPIAISLIESCHWTNNSIFSLEKIERMEINELQHDFDYFACVFGNRLICTRIKKNDDH